MRDGCGVICQRDRLSIKYFEPAADTSAGERATDEPDDNTGAFFTKSESKTPPERTANFVTVQTDPMAPD